MTYPLPDASEKFHDYILIWTKEHLQFFVDDVKIFQVDKEKGDTVKEWPFDLPHYIIMNLAVGGWYGGPIEDKDLPFQLEIESIKVYQQE
jgi:beta-glucanase (GH16 family)